MREETSALPVIDRKGEAVILRSFIFHRRDAIVRSVDHGVLRDAKIDAFVPTESKWCVRRGVLPEALRDEWCAGERGEDHGVFR